MSKPKEKEKETKPWEDVGIGDQVKHPDWGTGTVLFRSGSGDHSKAIVVFPEEGQKKLMLKYAKLKKVGSAPRSEVQAKLKAIIPEKPAPAEEEAEDKALMPPDEVSGAFAEEEEADIFEDDEEEQFSDRDESGGE